ncbi:MAG: dihydropteroate synthase [Clostridia bacterium]|nr:dihydropteroate synthase [Clostridia bacterium]MBN2882139.1 dihydropteroate synthase [Clostridia bacterium]
MKGNARILVINSPREAEEHIAEIGAEEGKVNWLASQADFLTLKFEDVSVTDAIMVKNDTLEMGAHAAYNKGVYDGSVTKSDVIIAGSRESLERISKRLRLRTRNTSEIADALDYLLKVDTMRKPSLMCRDKRIPIGRRTIVMGVLEMEAGEDEGIIFERAEKLISEGADILDITCNPVMPRKESIVCSKNIIRKIRHKSNIPICTDVSLSEDAKYMLDAGADIINDIWSLRRDSGLASVVASYKAGIILMHNTENRIKTDLMGTIYSTLRRSLTQCQDSGVGINSIVIDPGFGFGKTTEQTLGVIRKLRELKSLGVPLMVGPSGKMIQVSDAKVKMVENLEAIASIAAVSILNGADIIRVHDVEHLKRTAEITDAIIGK